MNLCRSCRRAFASVGAFNAHRRGRHAYLAEAARPDGRRCLTLDELADAGLELDTRGRWRLAADATRAQSRFAPDSATAVVAPGVHGNAPQQQLT